MAIGVKPCVPFLDGGFFGELALMYNQPRAATIVSTSNGVIWGLDRRTFRRIIVKHSQARRRLFENIFQNVPMLSALSESGGLDLSSAYLLFQTFNFKVSEKI